MKAKWMIGILGSILMVSSCGEEFLDRNPINRMVDEGFYKTPEDAFKALVAVYDVLQYDGYGNIILTSEICSDDCFGGGGENDNTLRRFDRFEPSNDLNAAAWTKYYKGIYRANVLLQKLEGIDWGGDTTLKVRYAAETRFLRAYFYFDLVRMFGHVPLMTEPLAPGNYSLPQAESEAVYKVIAEDLVYASENLEAIPYSAIPASEYGRATRWAAESLLGRAFLYYTGYYNQNDLAGVVTIEQARTYIDDVIQNSGHDLVASFPALWPQSGQDYVGEDNMETVFAVKYTYKGYGDWNQQDGNRWMVMMAIRNEDVGPYHRGWGAATVNPDLWDAYPLGDSRREASIISIDGEGLTYTESSRPIQYTGYFWKKYSPMNDEFWQTEMTNGADWQVDNFYDYVSIRFADVLLMGAELHLQDQLPAAQSYYNRVRDRAFGDFVHTNPSLTAANGKILIMEERRLELALEGQRYWDLLRQGMAKANAALDSQGPAGFEVNFREETKGLLAIPETQISLSEGAIVQNEGW